MRYLVLLLFLVSACATTRTSAQAVPVDFFLDPAGKAYYLLADSRLVTRNKLGQTVNFFYDSSLGHPDYVDVTNPFSILLYYQDFGRLVTLDRTLSELSRKDLFAIEDVQQPGVIARANDNQVWVYDSWDYRLKLLNDRGDVERTTNNLRLELKIVDDPDAIFVDRGTVALLFRERKRLAVLTNYGRFRYWVDLPSADNISWLTPYLVGADAGASWRWTAGAARTETWANNARPRVQGEGQVKRLAIRDGFYQLNAAGEVELITVKD